MTWSAYASHVISGKLKKFKVQLLRSNALFLCRHEDTSLLRLFSDERSGRQIVRNFSFRQGLHLLLELLKGELDDKNSSSTLAQSATLKIHTAF